MGYREILVGGLSKLFRGGGTTYRLRGVKIRNYANEGRNHAENAACNPARNGDSVTFGVGEFTGHEKGNEEQHKENKCWNVSFHNSNSVKENCVTDDCADGCGYDAEHLTGISHVGQMRFGESGVAEQSYQCEGEKD